MKKKKLLRKWISLLAVCLMMIVAAATVNKIVFGVAIGKKSESKSESPESSESVSELGDGSKVIHTAGVPGVINGYAGAVDMDITIKEGKIVEVEALPNSETPSFFRRASGLLTSWNGSTVEEARTMKVDAVSGATYSSAAIINNVNAGLSYYAGLERRSSPRTPWKVWVALVVTLAACVFPLFVRSRMYRNVQLVANVVVLGFWCGQFLDYSVMLRSISHGISLTEGCVVVVMLVAAFVYPLFGRPQYYCSHICPLGSAQQLVGELCGYKLRISAKMLKGLNWFRKILWSVLMVLLWLDVLTGWMDLELFQAFQIQSASLWIIGAASVFVALSAIVSRPYCRFVCPTGSVFKASEGRW